VQRECLQLSNRCPDGSSGHRRHELGGAGRPQRCAGRLDVHIAYQL